MDLARVMASSPNAILQKLAETALALCGAQSAGLSLLEDHDQGSNFHWRAIAGQWASHVNGGTPRNFGPCGVVLDRNVPLVCSHPELDFPYFGEVTPLLEEALLVPFHVRGEARGTIWIVSHDGRRRFDAEDLRVMTDLSTFAATAYQMLLSLNSTQHVASIVDSSEDAIASKDLDGVIKSWNAGAEKIFGYTAHEVIGKSIMILIPPGRENEETEILRRIRQGERVGHYDTVRQHKSGSRIDISLTISPIKNVEGKIIGASKIARDISERKRNEAQITILAREAEHRVKNVLATVQAMVQLSHADTPAALKHAIQGRLHALANVQRLFVETRWEGAEIQNLVAEELAAYSEGSETRVKIDGPKLLLEPSVGQAIAVTLHELVTNAAKYGALSAPDGRVQFEWSHERNGRLVFRWTERGGPPVKPPTREGFGTRATKSLIEGQLNGELRYDWCPEGLACEIAIPAGAQPSKR